MMEEGPNKVAVVELIHKPTHSWIHGHMNLTMWAHLLQRNADLTEQQWCHTKNPSRRILPMICDHFRCDQKLVKHDYMTIIKMQINQLGHNMSIISTIDPRSIFGKVSIKASQTSRLSRVPCPSLSK
jgi:hypothetical protein